MTPEVHIVLGWMLILFGACGGYAMLLHKLKPKYDPNYVWLVMLGGGALLWAGPAAIEWSGVTITSALLALSFTVAYAPIGIWQLVQFVARRTRNGHAKP